MSTIFPGHLDDQRSRQQQNETLLYPKDSKLSEFLHHLLSYPGALPQANNYENRYASCMKTIWNTQFST